MLDIAHEDVALENITLDIAQDIAHENTANVLGCSDPVQLGIYIYIYIYIYCIYHRSS